MGRSRGTSEIARDRKRIGELYLTGCLQTDIAEKVGISQATVSRDLKALFKAWQKSALVAIDKAKAKELAKVDNLELVYWDAWERSCRDAETVVKKTKGRVRQYQDEEGQFVAERPAELDTTSKGQSGNPRFLQGVQWCIDKRCKILGIDAPQRLEHSGPGGEPLPQALTTNIVLVRGTLDETEAEWKSKWADEEPDE